jgi:hypothetical protein
VGVPEVLMAAVVLGESPRWHDGRLWFSDWGANQVIALGADGSHQVVVTVASFQPPEVAGYVSFAVEVADPGRSPAPGAVEGFRGYLRRGEDPQPRASWPSGNGTSPATSGAAGCETGTPGREPGNPRLPRGGVVKAPPIGR